MCVGIVAMKCTASRKIYAAADKGENNHARAS